MKNNKKNIEQIHGLTAEEYQNIIEILKGREPNEVELGIFSVMWSEHCSYKSSKKWLKTLPTEAPWVICGPGENAGVVDIGHDLAVVFKMESHNHPSYIEPYQGAATGVGGILRDVFTMGARPIANMNSLRFGEASHHKTKHLLSGVVSGIGGYGNCVGVPTIGGELNFHKNYNGNILVNAMTVGIAEKDKIFYSAATGPGNPVVYVGSKTGRDGIHGATMASSEFDDEAISQRPTVQVGDPFTEKLLIEACLELMSTDAIIAIQDMGAAGLTCSTFEMCSKGGTGIEMNLDLVPIREKEMTAYEIMLSESQERMLMVLRPDREKIAQKIFEKWDLDFAVIGHLTNTKRLILKKSGQEVANLPIDPLSDASPEYNRPWITSPKRKIFRSSQIKHISCITALKKLISCPDLGNRKWIWEQYDHMVMGDTVQRPGGDASVVRIHLSNRGLAITTDCTPRYVNADPYEGGKQAVAEACRNLSSTGAKPIAVTDNLNFGNPEKPLIMGQLVQSIQGIGEACKILEMPVVSGNVSLYNETDGQPILPTPTIGAIGIIDSLDKMITSSIKDDNETIILIGNSEDNNDGWLGQSLYLRELFQIEEGAPPPVDLQKEKLHSKVIRDLISEELITSCHDVSDGGIGICLAEMSLMGNIGVKLNINNEVLSQWLFGEDQGRYIITCKELNIKKIIKITNDLNVSHMILGITGGKNFILGENSIISLDELRKLNENWMKEHKLL